MAKFCFSRAYLPPGEVTQVMTRCATNQVFTACDKGNDNSNTINVRSVTEIFSESVTHEGGLECKGPEASTPSPLFTERCSAGVAGTPWARVRGCGMRSAMSSRAGHAGLTRPYQGSLPYSSCSGKPLVIFKLGAARWDTKIQLRLQYLTGRLIRGEITEAGRPGRSQVKV